MAKVLKEKIVFNNWLIVEEGRISTDSAVVSRMRLNQAEAAAVLVYNTSSSSFILIQQFRYAIYAKTKEPILEVPAGRLDEAELPEQAAARECLEETGYRIDAARLVHVASCFMAPGFSSEILHHYYAEVSDADKVSEGGGLETEGEEIAIMHLPRQKFIDLVRSAGISDAKTYLLGLWWISNRS